jgi:hypothetical protein
VSGAKTDRSEAHGGGIPAAHFLRRLEWPLVATLALVAGALGVAGFHEFFAAAGEPRSAWDLAYLTLQLFTLESGSVSGSVPWELQIARLLAPAVAGYAAVKALAIVFREQFERFRVRLLRHHIVICGLGRKGLLLAKSLRRRGDRVVVIEPDSENHRIETARDYGAIVLLGDARDPQLLRKAGVNRASNLVAVGGDDGLNAEVAVQARKLVQDRRGTPLSCLVHIVDPELCSLLQTQEVGRKNDKAFRLDFFNVFESGARTLLAEYPVGGESSDQNAAGPHVIVLGLGRFGEALTVQAARDWSAEHERTGQRLRVTIVDQRAEALSESLRRRYPWITQLCEISAQEMLFESPEFHQARFLFDSEGRLDVSMVYVCMDDDSQAVSTALTAHRQAKSGSVPIIVRMVHGTGLASLLEEDASGGEFESLHAFALLDRMCNPDLLLAGVYEIIARAMHEEYVRRQRARGEDRDTNPALVPWEELAETFKESNRDQAAHIGVKLGAVGCDIAPLTDWDAENFEFSPDEVERLSIMEHERWMNERRRDGWRQGPKDPERKTSPYLIPWSELGQEIREYDRVFIRGLPRFLARAGLQIVRVGGQTEHC